MQRTPVLGTLVLLALAYGMPSERPGADAVASYNYVLGTQTIGAKYRFSKDDVLVESARAILEMGSNILKISVAADYAQQYDGVLNDPSIQSPLQLVRDQPSFRRVLHMPFSHILLWVYPFHVGWWADGLSQSEKEQTYRQMYELAAYLLTEYSGTGKTFYLGHWEGDWHLLGGYDLSKDPGDTAISGMVDWLNTRQQAIEDARKAIRHRRVEVYGYAEVNLVQKAIRGGKTVTNDVLPRTRVDFVSYSSYDSLSADEAVLRRQLTAALEYIANKLPPKRGVPGKRVFIGEYGFPRQHHTAERQAALSKAVARVAVEWECPFALYWQMYCNEKVDGKHRGFWLIDEAGVRQPAYTMHAAYYRQARTGVSAFVQRRGRLPNRAEFRGIALRILR